jgi:hypothetical protein
MSQLTQKLLADDGSETVGPVSLLCSLSDGREVGLVEEVFVCRLLAFLVSLDPMDMLLDVEGGEDLGGIVVEQLVDWRELLSYRFDALLCDKSTDKSTERIEDTSALEGKQVEEPHHLSVVLELLVLDFALFRKRLGELYECFCVFEVPDFGQSLVVDPELLERQEADMRRLAVLDFLEVSNRQITVQRQLVCRLHGGLLKALELQLDFGLELLCDSIQAVLFKFQSISDLEAVRGEDRDLVDGVVDAVGLEGRIVVGLAFFESHSPNSLEEHLISILELVLLVLKELHNTLLCVGHTFDHHLLELFPVLIQDFKFVSEIIEDPGEYTVAVRTNELDAPLAAELVDDLLCCVIGFGHDHDIVGMQTPGLGL